jgi:hypothetical protein
MIAKTFLMTVMSLVLIFPLLALTSCFRREWSEEETKYYSSLSTPANFWWHGMFGEIQDASMPITQPKAKPAFGTTEG